MIHIISGTNRPQSRSLQLAKIVEQKFAALSVECKIIDLCHIPLHELNGSQYADNQPEAIKNMGQELLQSEGMILIVPEYNGSMPGALKYFIDHWKYPDTFEFRPVAFIGLGGRFGGLRPVEHLHQVFSYRNSYIYPERVILTNVWNILKDGKLEDPMADQLLGQQASGFSKFVKALKAADLDANAHLKNKARK